MYNAYYTLPGVLILNKTHVYTFEQKSINKIPFYSFRLKTSHPEQS